MNFTHLDACILYNLLKCVPKQQYSSSIIEYGLDSYTVTLKLVLINILISLIIMIQEYIVLLIFVLLILTSII